MVIELYTDLLRCGKCDEPLPPEEVKTVQAIIEVDNMNSKKQQERLRKPIMSDGSVTAR